MSTNGGAWDTGVRVPAIPADASSFYTVTIPCGTNVPIQQTYPYQFTFPTYPTYNPTYVYTYTLTMDQLRQIMKEAITELFLELTKQDEMVEESIGYRDEEQDTCTCEQCHCQGERG